MTGKLSATCHSERQGCRSKTKPIITLIVCLRAAVVFTFVLFGPVVLLTPTLLQNGAFSSVFAWLNQEPSGKLSITEM